MVTLLLNIGVEFYQSSVFGIEDKEQVLGVVIEALSTIPKDDFESGFRALVAGVLRSPFINNDFEVSFLSVLLP